MTWESVASAAISVASICAQAVGLSRASSAAIAVARGGQANRTFAMVAGVASPLAIALALLALALAARPRPKEPRWVRMSVLCLAVGAMIWSVVVV